MWIALVPALLSLALGAGCSSARDPVPPPVRSDGPFHWIAAWGTAPQPPDARAPDSVRGFAADTTLRQVVLVSADGSAVRVHLTDRYGYGVAIAAATVGAAANDGRLAGRPVSLRFSGRASVRVPAGGSVVSDPVALRVRRLERVAISLYLSAPTGPLTFQGTSQQRSFVGPGDEVGRTDAAWVRDRPARWFLIDGLDTRSPVGYRGTVVAFGDSITAGFASRLGSFGAWPDDLIRRLAGRGGPDTLAVLDAGISGNRLLSSAPCCGLAGVARFDADALGRPGVRTVILLEGTNDIGFGAAAARASHRRAFEVSAGALIAADERLIAAAHRAGVRVIGGTLSPFRGAFYWTPTGEAEREAYNHWVRTGSAFDATVDFATALASPDDPERIAAGFDSGDHLHPNNAGYAAMARAVDLSVLLAG